MYMTFANLQWPTNGHILGLLYNQAYRQIIRFTERQTKDDAATKDGKN